MNDAVIYGYIRVSTDKQDYEGQKHGILEYANKNNLGQVTFVEETISSRKKYNERDLSNLIEKMNKSDILITSELSRIGRNLLEIMSIFQLLMEKDIRVHIIKGNYILGDDISSSVLIFAFGLAGQIERDLNQERTKEKLDLKKKELKENGFFISKDGKKITHLGRKKGVISKSKLDKYEDDIINYLSLGVSKSAICKLCDNVARTTLDSFIKTRNLSKKVEMKLNEKNTTDTKM